MSNKLKPVLFLLILILSTSLFSKQINFTLKVGLYNNYPKIYQTEHGEAGGIFPELLEEIAKHENWQLEYIFGTWEECLQHLKSGDIDIMPDVAVSVAREKIYDFHQRTVLTSWGCFYTKSHPEINSVLDLKGKTVAVMRSSILTTGQNGIYNLAERYGIECLFQETDDYNEVFSLVETGEADVGIVNRFFGSAFEKQFGLHQNNFIFYPTALRYAFPKNAVINSELCEKIDSYLTEWQNEIDSIYYTILKKYDLYPKKSLPDWLWPLIIFLIILIIIFLIASLILRWQFKNRTRLLQQSNADLLEEISEHQQTLKLLEESREFYRSFVENIPGLVFMYDIDPQGKRVPLIQTNRSEEFLGAEVGKLTKFDINNFFEYILPEDRQRLQEESDKIETDNDVMDVEYRVKLNEDKIKWFRSIGRVKLQANGNRRWHGVILDIDDRMKVERQLELHRKHLENLVEIRTKELQKRTQELNVANVNLKEADRLKSIFLASMSHELRTPLNSIIGFTGILLMGMVCDLTDEQRKQLNIVKKSAHHLLDLINDILDISKVEAGKVELTRERFEVNEVISELVKSIQPKASEKGITLDFNFAGIIEQFSDRRRFTQIILNLLSNAVKFTEQGSVTISSEVEQGNWLKIMVSDTGIGIKEKDVGKLFEPFQQIDSTLTKKYEGTGLGLHLTQKILELLKGRITVSSKIDEGTTFIVTLPLYKEEENNATHISD
ncbi:MAG: transporter substrate-binding domain-containing protein [Candidatus Cloacimonetes bacterium]|nr:transporter substrate-binding domain-containing protein [Candidatus Cloacimonadota bacterium]